MKLILLMAALAALATPQQQQLREPAPRLARIEMETTSWGRLIARWSISADGTLLYTESEADKANISHYVTRSYAAGTAGFRKIRVLIGEAEARGGGRIPCTQAITDAVYGSVKWVQPNGRRSELSFYTACSEYGTRRVVKLLGQANEIAAGWAKQGRIVATTDGDPRK